MTSSPVLEARGIVVRYGGVAALKGVDLALVGGTVHAIVGENGAGKSTLMKVLSGAVVPDEGQLTIDGQPIAFREPRDARRAGIRMVHQELSLVPALTVAENIVLGSEPARWGVVDRRTMRARTTKLLEQVGETIDPGVRVETLSLAKRQMVEIAKALASDGAQRARVLILDEPTAILSQRECEVLFIGVARLAAAGMAVLYCTHRLEEVARIASEVTVLRDGQHVISGPAGELPRDVIIRHMVGRDLVDSTPTTAADTGAVALRVERLSSGIVRDATFELRRGEVLGIVGLVGAGRTELARAIMGAERVESGTVTLDGQVQRARQPRDAARAGIGFIPEDRKGAGLIMHASVQINTTLARLRALSRFGIVDRPRERRVTQSWIDQLRIKASSPRQPVERLSGGNQQKVVLARWLVEGHEPLRVLIVDEPTRGVDVGARAEIYRMLRQVAGGGTAVLVITSDLPEALELCRRLLVMREGRIVGELADGERSVERIGQLMVPA